MSGPRLPVRRRCQTRQHPNGAADRHVLTLLPRLPLTPPPSSDIFHYTILEEQGAAVVLDRLNLTSRVSTAAVELLCEMLVINRDLRPRSAQLLAQHHFFTAPS